jgi:hypothetical protein
MFANAGWLHVSAPLALALEAYWFALHVLPL